MIEITDSYLRTLETRLGECSTYAQFSEFFIKNRSILYSGRAFKMFIVRLAVIKEGSTEQSTRKMCDILLDDIFEEHQIAFISNDKGTTPLPISLQFYSEEGKVLEDTLTEIIKATYIKAKGKRKEVCRVLGISNEKFDELVEDDKERRKIINDTRKNFKTIKDQ